MPSVERTISIHEHAPGRTRRRPALARRRREALLPFADLLYQAQRVHRQSPAERRQLSTLLSIKTAAARRTAATAAGEAAPDRVDEKPLLGLDTVRSAAQKAKTAQPVLHGRGPKRDLGRCSTWCGGEVAGPETCCTLGMLKEGQAEQCATRASTTTTTTSTPRPSTTAK
jgi:biotin synthase